jgi:hypothetical protein
MKLLKNKIKNNNDGAELSTLLRKAPTLIGMYNTSYMARFARPNRLTPTSYISKLLYEMAVLLATLLKE